MLLYLLAESRQFVLPLTVRIKLAIGLAVATAAPSKGRSPCREMTRTEDILQSGVSGSFFMIRGVGKTWGTSYRAKQSLEEEEVM